MVDILQPQLRPRSPWMVVGTIYWLSALLQRQSKGMGMNNGGTSSMLASASAPALAEVTRVAAAAADSVDRESRFPAEAIAALKEAKLLSCSLPVSCGGQSYGITELAAIARAMGAACSSAGMVFAM